MRARAPWTVSAKNIGKNSICNWAFTNYVLRCISPYRKHQELNCPHIHKCFVGIKCWDLSPARMNFCCWNWLKNPVRTESCSLGKDIQWRVVFAAVWGVGLGFEGLQGLVFSSEATNLGPKPRGCCDWNATLGPRNLPSWEKSAVSVNAAVFLFKLCLSSGGWKRVWLKMSKRGQHHT